jgi:alpha-tubulin suppressor-like RCC1 family protein
VLSKFRQFHLTVLAAGTLLFGCGRTSLLPGSDDEDFVIPPSGGGSDAGTAPDDVCRVGLGDCDGDAANGCETDFGYDSANCGSCGLRCGDGLSCAASKCRSPSSFASVSAGAGHSCALRTNGEVWCWGDNYNGELGRGFFSSGPPNSGEPWPARVVGIEDAVEVAAGGYHSCAKRRDESIWCWGYAAIDAETHSSIPVFVTDEPLGAIAAGGYHNVALDRAGNVYEWGISVDLPRPEGWGLVPVPVPGAEGMRQVSASRVSCGVRRGEVWCWGANLEGLIGTGENVIGNDGPYADPYGFIDVPQHVTGLPAVERVNLGYPCAVSVTGAAYCWGTDLPGQSFPPRPLLVSGMADVVDIVENGYAGCALRADGSVLCWGIPSTGDSFDDVPKPVAGIDRAESLTVGPAHACVIQDDDVLCWGDNAFGDLGDGTREDRLTPGRPAFEGE